LLPFGRQPAATAGRRFGSQAESARLELSAGVATDQIHDLAEGIVFGSAGRR
jgi:hypothetical protein